MKTLRTIVGATAAGILALGLLTACTPDEPTPTPSPDDTTPTATSSPTPEPAETEAPEPETADEAVDAGYEVAKEYFRIWDETGNEHPDDTSRLEQIAAGNALDRARKIIESNVEKGITPSGYVQFTLLPEESYAAPTVDSEGEVESQFGQPILVGCMDYGDVVGTKEDGTKITAQDPAKTELIVRYSKADSKWTVISWTNTLEGNECDG